MSDLPSQVREFISKAVGESSTQFRKMDSDRTFLVQGDGGQWVARIEKDPRPRTRRIPIVQARAQSVGVRVPQLLGHGSIETNDGEYYWILEEFVTGSILEAAEMGDQILSSIFAEFGEQLRLLHSIEVDGYWSLRPDTESARLTWNSWIEQEIEKAESAAKYFPGLPMSSIRDVANELAKLYDGPACLCHGDFKWNNVLIDDGRLSAIIDWEGAVSNDPAHDIGYWYSWHDELRWLQDLMGAYRPADPVALTRRIYAHAVLAQSEFVCDMPEHAPKSVVLNIERFNDALR